MENDVLWKKIMGMIPQYSHCPKQIKIINPKNL